ncbi:chromate transporter [Andreprevotia chitinilytica]|uniref:chromate transporter n=1 Tax=Andreprevotia chitinilytica TaxID=396808 RepID=UPI00055389D1|nr:chromate transporter [Andreprevotia chitinilytica]
MPTSTPASSAATQTLSRRELFSGFFKIGLSGFGGVLPLAHRVLVEDLRWLDDAEFTEVLSLGQTLPGPNICNMSVVIGARFQGAWGAVVALAGLLFAPLCIIVMLGLLYARYGQIGPLPHMLNGIAAVGAGLMGGTGVKLAIKLERTAWVWAVAAAAFAGTALFGFHLVGVLLVLAPLSIGMAWYQLARQTKHNSEPEQ